MQLSQDLPDFRYVLRAVREGAIVVNDRELTSSFVLAPNALVEDWTPAEPLRAEDLSAVLAMDPEIVLLGTGATQCFPAADVMAACLTRGIGIEVMNNAAAARTFNVLAGESRRVVAAFLLPR
jgi:uncharacterized protein